MARKTSPLRTTPSPVPIALERLAKLSGAGTAADRMAREAGKILAGWTADPSVDPHLLAEQMEEMRENLALAVATAEDQVADVDSSDKAAVRQASATLSGLRAAMGVFAAGGG